ncbi:MAG: hypothetical protein D3915_06060 [Candidatus Electrothrix sp. AU1_5]|nr:hypothetical protein [Candidatus Electrothrix gigas]
MIYILSFCIAIVAITITKFAVPFILSRARISHHLVATVNFFLNIAVLLSTFFVLFFLLHFSGVIDNTNDIEGEQHETTTHTLENKKDSNTSKLQDKLAKGKEDERIEQERLKAENERQRIELEKQRLLAEKKERERIEKERLQLEAENERQRIELEKQRLLAEKKEHERIEKERLQLEAEKERRRIELEKQRRLLAEKKERERIEKERLKAEKERRRRIERAKQRRRLAEKKERERRKKERLKAKKKSPCEKIQDSLDKRSLNDAIRTLGNNMIVLYNKQGVPCYIIPNGIKDGYIKYQIEQAGNSALCFYKERIR